MVTIFVEVPGVELVVVVVTVESPLVVQNVFSCVPVCLSGLVTTTFQTPVPALEGMANLQVINSGDDTDTLDATMDVSPFLVRLTFAPDTKYFPLSAVIETVVPVLPEPGSISDIMGAGAEGFVVVATVVAVVAFVVAVVVATVVGLPVGTADTSMVPDFSVYEVSTIERLTFSVFESSRYPQLPSVLG